MRRDPNDLKSNVQVCKLPMFFDSATVNNVDALLIEKHIPWQYPPGGLKKRNGNHRIPASLAQ
jgi:hypothetical protein